MTELAHVAAEAGPGWVAVSVRGEIDMSNAARIGGLVGDHFGSSPLPSRHAGAHRLAVLDLTRVTYLDSAGVALLDTLAGQARADGQELRIIAPAAGIARRTLAITGLDTVVQVDETREEALRAAATP